MRETPMNIDLSRCHGWISAFPKGAGREEKPSSVRGPCPDLNVSLNLTRFGFAIRFSKQFKGIQRNSKKNVGSSAMESMTAGCPGTLQTVPKRTGTLSRSARTPWKHWIGTV